MANNNKHTGPNVPALRFPEFSGEWESCTLGDITNNFSRRNKDRIQYPMFSVTNNRGFVPQSEQFEDREMVGEDIQAYKVIEKGDFAYNPARINVGSIAKYEGNGKCMISSLYVCFNTIDRIDRDWFMHLLKTPKMNFYYNLNGEGGVRVYLFYPNFARIRSSYPSLAEQKKIAAMLSLIDERIATQSKIIEEQETLLKSLADRMFSENQYSCGLSELVDIVKGKQVNADTLSEEGDYYVMNGGVAPSGYYSEYNVPAGSISISEGGNSCGYVQFNEKPFWSGGHCYSLRAKSDIVDYKYLYYFLKAKQSDVMALRIGSGLPNIQKKDIEKFTVSFPSMVQQLRYVKVLDAVSEQLDAEKSILVLYHKQKEHLLSEMFI